MAYNPPVHKIADRSYWGAGPLDADWWGVAETLVVHYSAGAGKTYRTPAQRRAHMRSLDDFHRSIGFGGIAYNFVVFQPWWFAGKAMIYEGRGWGWKPTAQGGANSDTLAVCVIANGQEHIMGRTVDAIAAIYRQAPATRARGHREYNSTACPGDELYSKLPKIRSVK